MKRVMNQSTLRRRFSLLNLTLTILFMALFTVVQFEIMDDIFLYAVKQTMITTSNEIAELDYRKDNFKSALSDIEANHSVYVEIYYPRDRLVYTSSSNSAIYDGNGNAKPTEELSPRVMKLISQETFSDGSYFEIRQEFYATAQYLVYGAFYENDRGIEIYYSTDLIKDYANTASWALFALSISIFFIVLAVVTTVAKMYLDPLQRIKSTTRRMAMLDFSAHCPEFKNKDLDELSDNINFLSSSLSASMKKLQNENRQLESDIEKERKQEKTRRSKCFSRIEDTYFNYQRLCRGYEVRNRL